MYHIDLQPNLLQSQLKGLIINSALVAMETAAARHYPTVAKT